MAKSPSVNQASQNIRIHPTALIEDGVSVGACSSVWDNVHIRQNAVIGHHCLIGEKSYVAYDVRIGNYVKINAFVYIPAGVTVEDKVMISAGTIFVNDKYPRAFDYTQGELAASAPNGETLQTLVREGATIGAAATILGGIVIGRFALVGAGSVVTKSVADHALVVGNPAKAIGWVCVCGRRLDFKKSAAVCKNCSTAFSIKDGRIAQRELKKWLSQK